MNNTNSVASVTLHNNTGNSDKISQCDVVQTGDLYLGNTLNGRRGGSITPRTKTKVPVSLDEAMKIYDGIIREKRADNYPVLEAVTAVEAQAASNEADGAFHQPQLLNDIDRAAAMKLIDDSWVMHEKKDASALSSQLTWRMSVCRTSRPGRAPFPPRL